MRGLLLIVLSVLLAVCFSYVERAHATAPGRNGRIVFRRFLDVEKTRAAIFTINPRGTLVRRVTRPAARVIDTEPDWSPRGSRIAFERQVPCPAGGSRDGLNNTCDLVYTVNPSGRGLKRLVSCGFAAGAPFPGNCVGADQPAWSPDGTRLAFIYNLADNTYVGSLTLDAGIWIVNADGTGLHQVTQQTPGNSWDFGPQWSPGGDRLVFERFDFGTHASAVFTVNVDGSSPFRVTPWELDAGNSPDWSPDGRWLLFRGDSGNGAANVYKAHPDGTALTNLTNEGPAGYHYASSSFSPDGTMIATARTPGFGPEGAADVFVMKADGSKIRAVTKTRLSDSGTDWGPLVPR